MLVPYAVRVNDNNYEILISIILNKGTSSVPYFILRASSSVPESKALVLKRKRTPESKFCQFVRDKEIEIEDTIFVGADRDPSPTCQPRSRKKKKKKKKKNFFSHPLFRGNDSKIKQDNHLSYHSV
ncbi:hypothetical protein PanWU01x14_124240 [Parasponia andersonii]|uniref:Uncharacterized protein n=1 Tax=Parasponia andersonii TaxID=3476 RepID=A0A2P5CTI5_PARAD|nr:hypothetical protein PanWU01x14_124240 [Parasponia andersonii]